MEGRSRNQCGSSYRLPGRTEKYHEKPDLIQSVYQPRFELGIRVYKSEELTLEQFAAGRAQLV
jgi:hypothetical protein